MVLLITACTVTLDAPKDVIFHKPLGSSRKSPITVYVDHSFNLLQKNIIDQSFNDWTDVSDGVIKFNIIWDVAFSRPYKNNTSSGIKLWWLDKIPEEISKKNLDLWSSFSGCWDKGEEENSGNIIIFSFVSDESLYKIVTHEIGHMLGLSHISSSYPTLMHYQTESDCITELDAIQLCRIYKCKPQPKCHIL